MPRDLRGQKGDAPLAPTLEFGDRLAHDSRWLLDWIQCFSAWDGAATGWVQSIGAFPWADTHLQALEHVFNGSPCGSCPSVGLPGQGHSCRR